MFEIEIIIWNYNVENNYRYVIIYGLYSAEMTIEYGMDQ